MYGLLRSSRKSADSRKPAMTILEFIAPIVSFTAGFFPSAFAEPFHRWLSRPILSLKFTPETGRGCRYVSRTPDKEGDAVRDAYYVRASVTNSGRRIARGCRAFLTMVEVRGFQEDSWRTVHEDPLPLPWAFIGPTEQDIPPRLTFFFDVFHLISSDSHFWPSAKPRPLIWNEAFKTKGTYRLHVLVAGEDIVPSTLTITFQWGGTFDSFDFGAQKLKGGESHGASG